MICPCNHDFLFMNHLINSVPLHDVNWYNVIIKLTKRNFVWKKNWWKSSESIQLKRPFNFSPRQQLQPHSLLTINLKSIFLTGQC